MAWLLRPSFNTFPRDPQSQFMMSFQIDLWTFSVYIYNSAYALLHMKRLYLYYAAALQCQNKKEHTYVFFDSSACGGIVIVSMAAHFPRWHP